MKAQTMNIIHFTTSECASSVDSWLSYRQRCGEKISFNESTKRWEPYDVPLIRLQFDVEDLLQVRNPRPMNVDALRAVLALHLVRSGIRDVEHPTETEQQHQQRSQTQQLELGNPHPYQKVSESRLLAYS